MKSTTNVFLEGLVSDMHPLTTSQKCVTDALNATLLTFNGNEQMLQNDMGNTLIQDTATGNIMGLTPGFIPVGMKEHGGIMYIASVGRNAEGKTIGEIGTIPSPIIRDFYKDSNTLVLDKPIPINVGDALVISGKMYPTDKFIVNLKMNVDDIGSLVKENIYYKSSALSASGGNPTNDPNDMILERKVITSTGTSSIKTPLISYNGDSTVVLQGSTTPVSLFSTKGVYKMNLYSSNTAGVRVEGSLMDPQCYDSGGAQYESKYWYTHSNIPSDIFPKDLLSATLNGSLKRFPSHNRPGKLSVKLQTEGIQEFGMIPRSSEPYNTPITHKYYAGGIAKYRTYFPGFYYSTDSGIYIDKLKDVQVIDENTELPMTLIYPYIGEKALRQFLDTSASTTLYPSSAISTQFDSGCSIYAGVANKLPQTLSSKDGNTFILSNIKGITDHTNSGFTYSTEGDGNPYSGLFGIELGDNYDNWYRLELKYVDQYGEEQGTFTTRFNPYLNDVFGVNIQSNSVEPAEALVLGQDQTLGAIEIEYSAEPEVIRYDTCISMTQKFDTIGQNDYAFGLVGPLAAAEGVEQSDWSTFTTGDSMSRTVNFVTKDSTYTSSLQGLYNSQRYTYWYKYTYPVVSEKGGTWNEPTLAFSTYTTSNTSGATRPSTLCVRSWNGSSSNDGAEYKRGDRTIHSTGWYTTMNTASTSESLSARVDWLIHDDTTTPLPRLYEANSTLKPSTQYPFSQWTPETSPTSIKNGLKSQYSSTLNFGNQSSVYFRWDKLCHGNSELHPVAGFTPYHFAYLGDSKGGATLFMRATYTYTFEPLVLTVAEASLSTTYSIVPYFTLKGLDEQGQDIYIRRFGKTTSNTDILYECNFEQDKGVVHNYIPDNGRGTETAAQKAVICSYNYTKPFHYYQNDWVESVWLEPGIYVLNMQRCPGQSNQIYASADKQILVDLTINVNGNTYSYSSGSINYWITGKSNTLLTGGLTQPSELDANAYGIYHPIVIVVKSAHEVGFSIKSNSSTHKFTRQSVGLFKLRNIGTSELLSAECGALKLKDVTLYLDYMKQVKTVFGNTTIYPDLKDQYNLIQKYGIFFKEGYVFIDGLVDGTQINRVEVNGSFFGGYPYIPEDPSILPVTMNDSCSNFIWNAYIMPKSVLTSSTDNFVFSNHPSGKPADYPVKADSTNLRKSIGGGSSSGPSDIPGTGGTVVGPTITPNPSTPLSVLL